ncbi:protein S-acyltransferase 8 isoform X1 [Cornus florida]|uniref:protein S-acyltransferase 8 isoform X1 n=1 Tax=Cornus florida TaxID=4283 RepID=UPI00289E538F|nr:protein S-acyltransferase 8 isoform X1 [Cornus florida]
MAKRVYELWKGSNDWELEEVSIFLDQLYWQEGIGRGYDNLIWIPSSHGHFEKFFLGGRVIFGPDARSLLVTLLLVIVPVVIFCVFVARHLRHEFSPHNAGYAILVLAIAFTIYVLVILFLTSARDPGIVPPNSHPPEEELRYDTSNSVEVGGRQTPSLQFPRTKEVMVNGLPVRVKYCDTCMLYRPPRCSHCSICNNCVERFDHHCPWVGQCIGMRNYRYFFLFVSSSTLLCIYVFAMSALYIKFLMDDHQSTVWKAMKESPASVILMAYSFISLWFVGGLTGFHLYLVSTNQTTYENFRYRADNRINVYDRGCLNNFLEVFCTKIKPSRNNFRAYVQEEVQRSPMPSTTRENVIEGLAENRRMKVEDDLEIGGDLLKISQRHNIEDIESDIRSRGSDVTHHNSSEAYSVLGSDRRAPTIQSETRHSSLGRRSGSWEIAPEVLPSNSVVTESRNYAAPNEVHH